MKFVSMKHFYSILIISLVIISCKKNDFKSEGIKQVDATLKEKVLNYLNKKITKVGDSAKSVIENLKNRIVWSEYETQVTDQKQIQTVFKIKDLGNVQGKVSELTYTSLYVVQNSVGEVRQVNTVEIDIPSNNQQTPNQLTLSLLNNHKDGYTGKLIRRNLSGYLVHEIDINSGQFAAFKHLSKHSPSNSNHSQQRIKECIDWYLSTYINGVLVSEVYLFTDCGNNVEEGGTGNMNEYQNYVDPCAETNALENDSVFISKMQTLRSAADSTFEAAWVKGEDANNNPDYELVLGNYQNPFLPGMDFGQPVDGLMHSHFDGGYSIFSAKDLQTLYNIYLDGNAKPGFTFAVVTDSTTYILKVDNESAFMQFGALFLSSDIMTNLFELNTFTGSTANGGYNIQEPNSTSYNEQQFLKLLRDKNSGLVLFSANNTNFNRWDLKYININNVVIAVEC